MTRKIFVDRSRVLSFQHCNRKRFLEYHAEGGGIAPVRTPLSLAVGKAVHAGLAALLTFGSYLYESERGGLAFENVTWRNFEDQAVAAALAEFSADVNALALDTMEAAPIEQLAQAKGIAGSVINADLGTNLFDGVPGMEKLRDDAERGKSDFDRYLSAEQSSLVEAQVRAYARRRLRPLLEEFEVLEVEREGEWKLAELTRPSPDNFNHDADGYVRFPDEVTAEIWFMSRPDALLRERTSNQLYLLSFKTAASWDVRKARDAEHDMQGLSEGVEIERRLTEWWKDIHAPETEEAMTMKPEDWNDHNATIRLLKSLDAPPRIHAIRYEYLLKGDRWKDKDLSARFGFEARAQRSSLVRGYMSAGMTAGDEQWCHSWDYLKDTGGGETSKLNYRAWRSEPVWPHMTIAEWIDRLDASVMTVSGNTGAELGYSSPAQAVGYTSSHPLDDVFVPPIVVYRSDDDLRDWIESTEAQERGIAEHVVELESATDEDSRRSLMNRNFPMYRRSCSYPTECVFTALCYGGSDIRANPLESGRYRRRVVNHPQEAGR